MGVPLGKGQRVSLTKDHPGLKKVKACLGWDVNVFDGEDFDLDASLFLLKDNNRVGRDEDFIFYGNLEHPSKAIVHTGDNRTGSGDGDDEVIEIDLSLIPDGYTQIAIDVTIYEAEKKSQNFGMVENAYIRLVNAETEEELLRYDLSEEYDLQTAIEFARIYKKNGEWKFKAVGCGYNGGLAAMCAQYGIDTE